MIDNLKTGDTVQLAVRPNDERLNPSARKRGSANLWQTQGGASSSGPSELYRREPSIGVPFVQISIDRPNRVSDSEVSVSVRRV